MALSCVFNMRLTTKPIYPYIDAKTAKIGSKI
jgi:hypothetical protein